jgi:hypothetical protein
MVNGDDILVNGPIDNMTLQTGLEVTDAFLHWYRDWLKVNSPGAVMEIKAINNLLDDLPDDIEDLEEEDEEEDEEDD